MTVLTLVVKVILHVALDFMFHLLCIISSFISKFKFDMCVIVVYSNTVCTHSIPNFNHLYSSNTCEAADSNFSPHPSYSHFILDEGE
jgi:hypothetical protein